MLGDGQTVHGKQMWLCEWTGEPISKRFRIPAGRGWTGTYGSPSCAITAIAHLFAHEDREVIHELIDIFEASLRRERGHEQTIVTIKPSPNYSVLLAWGGSMSLDDFHRTYEHDLQTAVFFQDTQNGEMVANQKKTDEPAVWHLRDEEGRMSERLVPRGAQTFLEFLWRQKPSMPLQLFWTPSFPSAFALTDSSDSSVLNQELTEVLGTRVSGTKTVLFHKYKLNKPRLPLPFVAVIPQKKSKQKSRGVSTKKRKRSEVDEEDGRHTETAKEVGEGCDS